MSTQESTEQRAGAARPALARLLALDPEEFAEHHWGKDLLLSTGQQRGDDRFSDLFSLDAVDELIARRGLRAPFLRVARDGTTHGDAAFTSGGGIGAGISDQVSEDKVLRLFAEGSTLVLQGLHRTWGPIVDFSQQLAADLGHPVQVNAYVTPSQNQGFADHYDVHDVFVLQVHGEKHWRIHEPVLRSPLRDQPWADRKAAVEQEAARPPVLDAVLRPGDCLYLPRGFIHAATALGGVSAHLTIGVHGWTRHHLVEHLQHAALAEVASDEQVRASLPLGVDITDPDALSQDVEFARRALIRAIESVPAAGLAEALRRRARDAQRAATIRPLAQLSAVDDLTADRMLRLRAHLMVEVDQVADGWIQVRSRVGRFGMSSAHQGALAHLRTGDPVRVGDLDPDGAVALEAARQFVRHGIAIAVQVNG